MKVTLAMAVYGQPLMLEHWFKTIRSYDIDTLRHLELLIVDDCGDPAAEIPKSIQALLPCQLFRVLKDIPWNQPGARNLAAEHVQTPIVLFVDPDMVFSPQMMRKLLVQTQLLPRGEVLRFGLKHTLNGRVDMTSPNTWCLHVADFLGVNGYDEDFSGHKGWSDVQLLDVMTKAFRIHHDKTILADFYSIDEIPDASIQHLSRNQVHNREMRIRKKLKATQMGVDLP